MKKSNIKLLSSHIIFYPVPKNVSFLWSFGSTLGLFFGIQVITGIFLSMHYCPNKNLAFSSLVHIIKDVNYGWFIQSCHANGASFIFILMYLHIGKGLFHRSYSFNTSSTWFTGVVIFLLMTFIAFVGYVLPWGQMSYWGATVITNFCSVIPLVGKKIAVWLWGGFSVNNPTLNRFFSLHYCLPFLLIGVIFLHFIFLHKNGSSNIFNIKIDNNNIYFFPYFFTKDILVFLIFIFLLFFIIFYYPQLLLHPDNYIPANPLSTPTSIVPEWYLLPFYAILRSIPNKAGGIICMLGAILILFTLPLINCISLKENYIKAARFSELNIISFCLFVTNFYLLADLGSKHPEGINNIIGIHSTLFYFFYFIIILPFISAPKFCKNLFIFCFTLFTIFIYNLFIVKYLSYNFIDYIEVIIHFVIPETIDEVKNLINKVPTVLGQWFHYYICSGNNPLWIALHEAALTIFNTPGLP